MRAREAAQHERIPRTAVELVAGPAGHSTWAGSPPPRTRLASLAPDLPGLAAPADARALAGRHPGRALPGDSVTHRARSQAVGIVAGPARRRTPTSSWSSPARCSLLGEAGPGRGGAGAAARVGRRGAPGRGVAADRARRGLGPGGQPGVERARPSAARRCAGPRSGDPSSCTASAWTGCWEQLRHIDPPAAALARDLLGPLEPRATATLRLPPVSPRSSPTVSSWC